MAGSEPDIAKPGDATGPELPRDLRFLKLLVTALAGTMILGIAAIVLLIAVRMPGGAPAGPALPDAIRLPEGVAAGAVTMGRGWIAVVTEAGDEILVFDAESGALRDRVALHGGG
jgi:hypothetical protein